MTCRIDVLEAREMRSQYQKQLLLAYGGTLIVLKANYPGANKHTAHTSYCVAQISTCVQETVMIEHMTQTNTAEGLIFYFLTREFSIDVKRRMIALETYHPLGRLVDLDVYHKKKQINRTQLGYPHRKCLLCAKRAAYCARAQSHPQADVINRFHAVTERYAAFSRLEALRFALIAEVSCYPKFGLVTPFSSGAHKDMDYASFLAAIQAIVPILATCEAIEPSQSNDTIFAQLQAIGLQAEQAMQKAAHANTHQGAIYSFLLVCMAERMSSPSLRDAIQHIAAADRRWLTDTHGATVQNRYAAKGVRAMAKSGFASVLSQYLPYFQASTGTYNERMQKTLLAIIAELEDTTVLYRGGEDGLQFIQSLAKQAQNDMSQLMTYCQECQERGLSAGGSADLLALILYLDIRRKVL